MRCSNRFVFVERSKVKFIYLFIYYSYVDNYDFYFIFKLKFINNSTSDSYAYFRILLVNDLYKLNGKMIIM